MAELFIELLSEEIPARMQTWAADDLKRLVCEGLKGAGLASLDQAEKRDTGKGEFWFAVIKKKGGPTADVLPEIIDNVMKALPWPKSMKTGSGTRLWVRPLQSVIALFDGKVLPGEVV